MGIQQEIEVLRRIPLFANIEPRRLKLLAFTSERLTFAPEQVLFRQGAEADAAYVIIDGQAEVLVDAPHGPVLLAVVERNSIVGETGILCDVPRTATVKAVTALETLRIRKDQFLQLLAEFPQLSIEIMRLLALRLSHTTGELTEARNRLRELQEA